MLNKNISLTPVIYSCKSCDFATTDPMEYAQHQMDKHTEIFQDKNFINLCTALKESFPDYKITINHSDKYKKKKYVIKLQHGNTCIIKYFNINDKNIEKLLSSIDVTILRINTILFLLAEMGKFEILHCESTKNHEYIFKFKVEGMKVAEHKSYYPFGKHKDLNLFANEFTQYFVKEITGVPKAVYDGGYFTGYSIKGIDLQYLMECGKSIKIEAVDKYAKENIINNKCNSCYCYFHKCIYRNADGKCQHLKFENMNLHCKKNNSCIISACEYCEPELSLSVSERLKNNEIFRPW